MACFDEVSSGESPELKESVSLQASLLKGVSDPCWLTGQPQESRKGRLEFPSYLTRPGMARGPPYDSLNCKVKTLTLPPIFSHIANNGNEKEVTT